MGLNTSDDCLENSGVISFDMCKGDVGHLKTLISHLGFVSKNPANTYVFRVTERQLEMGASDLWHITCRCGLFVIDNRTLTPL